MQGTGTRLITLLGLAVALPLLGSSGSLTGIPRSLADISNDIVARGNEQFGYCEFSVSSHLRSAALAVTAIETFKRSKWKAGVEWVSVRLGTVFPRLRENFSLGAAQIKLRTARKFVTLPDAAIARNLLADPCWSLQLAATILSDRMVRCGATSSAKECAVAAAASYNGQKQLSGPNIAYQVVFRRVYDRYAEAGAAP